MYDNSGTNCVSHSWTRDDVRCVGGALPKEKKRLLSFEMKVFIWMQEEWRSTKSKLLKVWCEVSTVSKFLGNRIICWCWSTVFSEVHSHLPWKSTSLFLLLTMLTSVSSRSWHLPTLPKRPISALMTMVSMYWIKKQTGLCKTSFSTVRVLSRERWKAPEVNNCNRNISLCS